MRKLITTAAIFLAVFLVPLFWTHPAQADVYKNYQQLAGAEVEGRDYRIISYDGPSRSAVIAIHGGGIERGTSQIARSVASRTGIDLYIFEGLKSSRNFNLHLTSTNFDEPIGKKLVANSLRTLSIHGCSGSSQATLVGGRDKVLAGRIKTELKKAGFVVKTPQSSLSGTNPKNICNENASKKGVQLELTYAMRQALLKDKNLYNKYVNALVKTL